MDSALYVVATPIGNLADMVPRAIDTLQTVDLIAAEDTRHSARLLRHFGIDTPCIAYHDHSDASALERIAGCLAEGGSVALISDAGTPLISDPGYRLLAHAHSEGWRVVPVPGPSALIAALSVAGLPTDDFRFAGFLPARSAARRTRLETLSGERCTLAFYEAPHRLVSCLEDMVECLGGERHAVLARELTKAFETVRGASLAEMLEWVQSDPDQQRGEIVLLVAGREHQPQSETISDEIERLLLLLAAELPPGKAAGIVAAFSGLPKNRLYRLLLDRDG
jgi:16S rRNA (cytidine1402-2'-O)-methyltransferase